MSTTVFYIPDTLKSWPWKRNINPLYAEVKLASGSWLATFRAFGPKAQRAFDACDFNLLASLAYPKANKEQLRAGCDLMNLFFVFDEYSDVEDEQTVQALANIVMDALRQPDKERPPNESVVGEIARQFWQRARRVASPSSQRRFLGSFDAYLASVVQQAEDRSHSYVRTMESYFVVRRDTIGAKPSFAILEFGMDIPDIVMNDPFIVRLTQHAIDLLIIGNDLCSYNVEQARDDEGHNLVYILMNQFHVDLSNAVAIIGALHDNIAEEFSHYTHTTPSWGKVIDVQVKAYIDGLGNWVRANDCWSFESKRYFGGHGESIQRQRWVTLLPKQQALATYN